MVFQNNLLMAAASTGETAYTVDNSVRYNDNDSPRLERTPSTPGNRMSGSISVWYKRGNLGSIQQFFNAGAGDDITFNASDKLTFADSSGVSYITTQVFRDPTAWGHLLFAWDTRLSTAGDRLRIYHNGTEITAFDTETNPSQYDQFEISNTVVQTIGANESDTEEFDGYFSQFYYIDGQQLTPSAFGESDDYGIWRPIEFVTETTGSFGGDLTKPNSGVDTNASGGSSFDNAIDGNPATQWSQGAAATPAGAWYEIEFGSAVAIRQVSIYVASGNNAGDDIDIESYNGSSWDVIQNITPVKNSSVQFFSVSDSTARTKWRFVLKNAIGHPYSWCFNEIQMFAAGSSVYGTNGFFLDFEDSSDFGNDVSGNNNDYTSSGLTSNDQVTDTPTNNFATLNVLDRNNAQEPTLGGVVVLSDGNLNLSWGSTNQGSARSTLSMTSGKYYTEVTYNDSTTSSFSCGVVIGTDPLQQWPVADNEGRVHYDASGVIHLDGSNSATTGLATYTTDDVIGMQVDMDASPATIEFFKNGTSVTTQNLNTSYDTWFFSIFVGSATRDGNINFGQHSFAHTPEAGFKALCTDNLPTPTLKNSDDTFVNINADAADVVSDLATARSDAGWGSDGRVDIYKNREITENWKVRFSDDSSNELVLNTDAAKVSNTSFTSGDSYQGFSLRMNATKGCATGTISHSNGSDTTASHGISLPTHYAVIMKREDSTGDWIMGAHPALTADYNIVLNSNSSETSTESIAIDASNVIVKSAVATGTYRYLVIPAWDGVVSMYWYTGNGNAFGPFGHTGQLGTVTMIDGIRTSTASEGVWFFNPSNTSNPTDAFFDTPDGSAERTGFSLLIDTYAAGIMPRGTHGSVNQSTRIMGFIQWGKPLGGNGVSPATAF